MKYFKKKAVIIMSAILSAATLFGCDNSHENSTPGPTVLPDAPAAYGPTPSESQLYYHKQEMAAFIHFGMNTFNGQEWGSGEEDPSEFTLESVDAEQWVSTFKNAGFGRLILVGKHHDGFCNWPSQYTEHSVKNSPHQVDIVGEVSAACTKYNLDMGIYLSPFDKNSKAYGSGNQDDYNTYYMNQLKEILGNPNYGNNGKFVEVWMDGASPSDQKYYFNSSYVEDGKENWFDVIHSYNEDTVIFCPVGATVRWNGTESGYSRIPCWSKINWSEQKAYYDQHYSENEAYVGHGDPDGENWSVVEADVSLVPGWFDYKGTPKSLSTLGDIYFSSVGRGCILLLNAAPGTDGKISKAQEERITEFGEAVRNTFKENLAEGAVVTATQMRNNNEAYRPSNVIDGNYDTYWTMNDGQTTGSITLDLGEEKTFDVISIQEYIPLGQRVSKFSVEVFTDGEWRNFGDPSQTGQTIGYKALIRDGAVTASQVRINILESQAVPVINSIGVYKADEAFEVQSLDIPNGSEFIDDTEFKFTGKWETGSAMQSMNDTHTWSSGSCTAEFSFTGNSFYIIGVSDPGHGRATVTVDGVDIGKANFYSKDRRGRQLVFSSPELSYGEHKVVLSVNGAPVDIDGVYFYNAGNKTSYSIEAAEYKASKEDKSIEIKVSRFNNIDSKSSVKIYTEPGTGVHGKVFTHIYEEISFEPGEAEKIIEIQLIGDIGDSPKDFYLQLELIDKDNSRLGVNPRASITVS